MGRTFVGFGFGPIQSALFLYEAYASGNFSRLVVAEVDQRLVDAVRGSRGQYTINIARRARIDQVAVRGVELYNPRHEADRRALVAAVVEADELATALPSVTFYNDGTDSSVAAILAAGLKRRGGTGKPGVLYAAENHNHAAEILGSGLEPSPLQFLNTVIGKMSGVISEEAEIRRLGLAPMTPGAGSKAILVEEFNRILISRIHLEGFRRGIGVFIEKDDLLPFEEAKLYGHNAIHALMGYLAHERGLGTMAQAAEHGDIMATARAAFLEESGGALVRKHAGMSEELFTVAGWRAYADDLLERMVNPHLNDLVARVIRDPQRKLGYDDRLYGTMRVALGQGIEPCRMARGAAAAVRYWSQITGTPIGTRQQLGAALRGLWGEAADGEAEALIDLTWRSSRGPA